jgi:hypothetical protein
MNISIRSRSLRTVIAASALGVAFAGGLVSGHSVDATPRTSAQIDASQVVSGPQATYYVVDSRESALAAERAEAMTAQERVLVGIVEPQRVANSTDNAAADRMTAMEAILVATSGR